MNCQSVMEQIIIRTGREALDPEVERHLWTCEGCSRVYLEQQALWRMMDTWETPEISPVFDRRLVARIAGRAAQSWMGLDWVMRAFQPLRPAFPAALACVMLAAALVVNRGGIVPAPPEPKAAVQTADRDDVRQIETALDDIRMLSEFEILAEVPSPEGKS